MARRAPEKLNLKVEARNFDQFSRPPWAAMTWERRDMLRKLGLRNYESGRLE